jgi:hypothetical protein
MWVPEKAEIDAKWPSENECFDTEGALILTLIYGTIT